MQIFSLFLCDSYHMSLIIFIWYESHTISMNKLEDLLDYWLGRLRGSLLDLAILYMAAYSSEKLYPYSIRKNLSEKWGSRAPPLPTIYSTIDRLVNNNYLESKYGEIDGKRVKRVISIADKGWDALESMMHELKQFLNVFEYHEKELEFPRRKSD